MFEKINIKLKDKIFGINSQLIKKVVDKILIILMILNVGLIPINYYIYNINEISNLTGISVFFKYSFQYFSFFYGLLFLYSLIFDSKMMAIKIRERIKAMIILSLVVVFFLSIITAVGIIPVLNIILGKIEKTNITVEVINKDESHGTRTGVIYGITILDKKKIVPNSLTVNKNIYYNVKIGTKINMDVCKGIFNIKFYKNIKIIR